MLLTYKQTFQCLWHTTQLLLLSLRAMGVVIILKQYKPPRESQLNGPIEKRPIPICPAIPQARG